jgi:zinc/manganese transport system ATP-binding protein
MIRLDNISKQNGTRLVFIEASAALQKGEKIGLVGPNGAGKTTLLRAIAGLHPTHEGTIARDATIGLLSQASTLDRSFPISCHDVVALGAYTTFGRLPANANHALQTVGLQGFQNRLIGTLSAGQFQRVLFARLIAQDAPIMLLDEPFNALDARTTADLMRVVLDWHKAGKTVIAVLHDLDLVQRAFPQTVLLARDKIAWGPTATALSPENRLRARLVAEAWDEDAAPCRDAA